MLTAFLLAAPLALAQATPPMTRGAVSVPDPPRGRPRTEIIISPAPTMAGGTIILTRPGRPGVTVCSAVVGVGII